MKGHTLPGPKQAVTNAEKRANLLKVVPNQEAYNKLSDPDKKGFDAAGKKTGLPQKKSPAPYAQLIAMAAPMVMDMMKSKDKKEE